MIKLAVIGDPIEHSLSPVIHPAVMAFLGIECEYHKVRVEKGGLSAFIRRVKAEDIRGFNLTMPHKADIIEYLDYIDPEAERVRSVNSVKHVDGKLYGYSTDAEGYVRSLRDIGEGFDAKNVVFIGAGGVVSALALKAAERNAKNIVILNRTESKAESICNIVNRHAGVETRFGGMTEATLKEHCKDADMVINATPMGMHSMGSDFKEFGFLDALRSGALVSDLIYNPPVTNLLRNAEKRGLKTLNGFGMLVYQALIADEIYTGKEIDFSAAKAMLAEKLGYKG